MTVSLNCAKNTSAQETPCNSHLNDIVMPLFLLSINYFLQPVGHLEKKVFTEMIGRGKMSVLKELQVCVSGMAAYRLSASQTLGLTVIFLPPWV